MPSLETVPKGSPAKERKQPPKKKKQQPTEPTSGKKQKTLASFFTPRKTQAPVRQAATKVPFSAITPVHHDKKQLMEIVMGTAVTETKKKKLDVPKSSSSSSLPILRNPGLKSLRVTPSPLQQTKKQQVHNKKHGVKLLEKLERSVDKEAVPPTDETTTEHVVDLTSNENTGDTKCEKPAVPETLTNSKADLEMNEIKKDVVKKDAELLVVSAAEKKIEIDSGEGVRMKDEEAADELKSDGLVVHTVDKENKIENDSRKGVETKEPVEETQETAGDNDVEMDNAQEDDDDDDTVTFEEEMEAGDAKPDKENAIEGTPANDQSDPTDHVEIADVESATASPLKNPPPNKTEAKSPEPIKEVEDVAQPSSTKGGAENPTEESAKPLDETSKIPEHVATSLKKHESMRSRYRCRAQELVEKARQGLPEERLALPTPATIQLESGKDEEFPSGAIASLALVVQESSLPLGQLAERAIQVLEKSCTVKFTTDAVMSKIKVLAARESYISVNSNVATTDVFEDTNADRMWRWELVSLDLLPIESAAKVKKARTSRRKLRTHHKATIKLLASLDDADRLLLDPSSKKEKLDLVLARVSTEEEKVLKFEREAEKHRLMEEAKKKKDLAKAQKELEKQKQMEQKQKEKEEAEKVKRDEKALRQAEKERKKQQAAKAREELKRKKEEEKEEQRKKERLEKERKAKKSEEKTKKQRAMMQSFFVGSPTKPAAAEGVAAEKTEPREKSADSSFNSEQFRSMIDSMENHADTPLFAKLSKSARASRSRRTRRVSVTVFVTVLPENPFAEQPYDEQREISVPNKYKFFRFHEDYRPPYHGTWSKPRSSNVTGKNPFGRETGYLNYEEDSEAEWEEGDDDQGEDCEDDSADDEDDNLDDEEGDTRVYNYQDGWLTHDDDLGVEEIDIETMALRKKKLEDAEHDGKTSTELSTVCVIAPAMGGLPITNDQIMDEDRAKDFIEGVSPTEALELFASHEGKVCSPDLNFCWDAFPPHLVEECTPPSCDPPSPKDGASKPAASVPKGKSTTTSQEMSTKDLKTFVKFVHKCTLPSKDRIVEQLRTLHKDIFCSRAQATRKLDAIAEKKRNPSGGVIWEVKKSMLGELGLEELLNEKKDEVEAAETGKSHPISIPKAKTPPPESTKNAGSKSGEKKRKNAPPAGADIGNLFAAFLKKQKTTDTAK